MGATSSVVTATIKPARSMPHTKAGAPEAPATMHSAGAARAPETPTSLSMGAQAFIATGRLTAKAAPRRAAAAAMRATPSRLPAPRPATTRTRAVARSSPAGAGSRRTSSRAPSTRAAGAHASLICSCRRARRRARRRPPRAWRRSGRCELGVVPGGVQHEAPGRGVQREARHEVAGVDGARGRAARRRLARPPARRSRRRRRRGSQPRGELGCRRARRRTARRPGRRARSAATTASEASGHGGRRAAAAPRTRRTSGVGASAVRCSRPTEPSWNRSVSQDAQPTRPSPQERGQGAALP